MNFLALTLLYFPTFTSVPDRKNHNFDYTDIVRKGTSLLFNMLSKFVIAFLARSKCLLISWLQSLPEMIVEPKKRKSVTASTFFAFYLLIGYPKMDIVVYACTSQTPNYPFALFIPPATISSFSKSVSLFLFCKFICIISF